MDMDGGSTSSDSTGVRTIPIHTGRNRTFYQFTQQSLPACKPVLTPAWVVSIFLLMGFTCVPVGLITLRVSHSVIEIVDRYDAECVPEAFKGNKVSYIKNDSISKSCSRQLKVTKYMKAPIYIYYQLDNFYQNHRRYVKSRSDQQLLHGLKYNHTSSCEPQQSNNGLPIVPCGLIAWSLFNDTYTFVRGGAELRVNRKNIAWKSDRDHKFGKQVYPFNFQNGTLIGGGKLNQDVPWHFVSYLDETPSIMPACTSILSRAVYPAITVSVDTAEKLSNQEDLIVWMRTAALPSFRKLYGRIEEDLEEDDVIDVKLMNNYNAYSFGGKKKLVISTSSWLGGRNDFLGVAYIFIGSSSIVIAIAFILLHVNNPRPYGDTAYISWNRKGTSS